MLFYGSIRMLAPNVQHPSSVFRSQLNVCRMYDGGINIHHAVFENVYPKYYYKLPVF